MGDTLCILLLDELAVGLALCLKQHFLIHQHRYFVFSSHVVSTVTMLSRVMDANTDRGIVIQPLPLTPMCIRAIETLGKDIPRVSMTPSIESF